MQSDMRHRRRRGIARNCCTDAQGKHRGTCATSAGGAQKGSDTCSYGGAAHEKQKLVQEAQARRRSRGCDAFNEPCRISGRSHEMM
eukprot:54306-Pelagomonas_calceolata.AAC.13